MSSDARKIDIVQTEKMNLVAGIKESKLLKMVKQAMVQVQNSLEDISPKTLNALIVDTSTNNHASSTCMAHEVDAQACTLLPWCFLLLCHFEFEMEDHTVELLLGRHGEQ